MRLSKQEMSIVMLFGAQFIKTPITAFQKINTSPTYISFAYHKKSESLFRWQDSLRLTLSILDQPTLRWFAMRKGNMWGSKHMLPSDKVGRKLPTQKKAKRYLSGLNDMLKPGSSQTET